MDTSIVWTPWDSQFLRHFVVETTLKTLTSRPTKEALGTACFFKLTCYQWILGFVLQPQALLCYALLLQKTAISRLGNLQECKFCVTVANPQGEDFPLIAVSEEFETMTGYTRNEILGVNCRFLNQGVDMNPQAQKDFFLRKMKQLTWCFEF